MKIRGIIFDFDGLILDTETPEVLVWEKIFSKFGYTFPMERYLGMIGKASDNQFVHGFLREFGLDENQLQEALQEYRTLLSASGYLDEPRAGIHSFIRSAQQAGLRLGVASSSFAPWVNGNLIRLKMEHLFDPICTRDDVPNGKPDPALYKLVLQKWGFSPDEVLVLEDSPNGILAAKRAGLTCIAVPNPITSQMDISLADMIFPSFEDFSLHEILSKLDKNPDN